MIKVNKYRTHSCGELRIDHVGTKVKVSGFIENMRDHGGVIFVDLRDQFGMIQLVSNDNSMFSELTKESNICVSGEVVKRSEEMINPKLETGEIEILVNEIEVLGKSKNVLPFEIKESTDVIEDLRLKYRYLDLRNKKVKDNILFRSDVLSFLRNKMNSLGFTEVQTPILTASSPEGARDYIVPSRKHKGKFYALPQAPQIFKELLMAAGFDKYYQIAPCFRDEDGRKDRSPGEFYQLDFEMAYATQEDVFEIGEEVLSETFKKFSKKEVITPFPRITYQEAMLKYGTDKPDLRNPLEIVDLTDFFKNITFPPFINNSVRGIKVENLSTKPNSWFNDLNDYAINNGLKGLGYIKVNDDLSFNGPIAKFLSSEDCQQLISNLNLKPQSVLFFIGDKEEVVSKLAGTIRTALGEKLELIDDSRFKFCYIIDFPMYEYNQEEGKYIFSHNPFSMPQGGLEALENQKIEDIKAYQYDIVCNGIELSSGAVRNHQPEIMEKAFALAGYDKEVLETKFPSLYNAFHYGAPPHAGMAPGLDRMIMLLREEPNIREVIAFPMNNNAQDLMMGAPTEVSEQQLREVHIKVR
ncbi:MAG: aspartate--tRNA ligase [Mollicutes bacterium]|nr:aspartate--tRNA ligase [Mollicutes bacterium]